MRGVSLLFRSYFAEPPLPKLKITKAAVQKMPAPTPSARQELYWDTELRGFGVLCSGTTNSRTFVVQGQVNGKSRRVSIGPTNVFSVTQAREQAQDLLAKMHLGVDPKEERAEQRREPMTLRKALDTYLTARKEPRPQSAADYREFIERWLSDWLDKPLSDINPDMVEQRHLDIPKQVAANRRDEAARRGRDAKLPDNVGEHTANQVMRIVRALWNHAADRDDQLPPNPTRRLKRAWYPEKRREDHVRPSEMPAFYEAVCSLENPVQRDYMLLLMFTGLRKSEAAALSWQEVDFHERVIRLPEDRTKAKRRLDLPMSDFLRDLLVQRRANGVEGPWVFRRIVPAGTSRSRVSRSIASGSGAGCTSPCMACGAPSSPRPRAATSPSSRLRRS